MSKLDAMTVNERLAESGLLAEFDEAVRDRNREKLIDLLVSVEFELAAANRVADSVLAQSVR